MVGLLVFYSLTGLKTLQRDVFYINWRSEALTRLVSGIPSFQTHARHVLLDLGHNNLLIACPPESSSHFEQPFSKSDLLLRFKSLGPGGAGNGRFYAMPNGRPNLFPLTLSIQVSLWRSSFHTSSMADNSLSEEKATLILSMLEKCVKQTLGVQVMMSLSKMHEEQLTAALKEILQLHLSTPEQAITKLRAVDRHLESSMMRASRALDVDERWFELKHAYQVSPATLKNLLAKHSLLFAVFSFLACFLAYPIIVTNKTVIQKIIVNLKNQ